MVVPGGTVVDRCGRIVSPRGTAVVPSGAGGFSSEQERIYFSYTSVTRFTLCPLRPILLCNRIQNYGALTKRA